MDYECLLAAAEVAVDAATPAAEVKKGFRRYRVKMSCECLY